MRNLNKTKALFLLIFCLLSVNIFSRNSIALDCSGNDDAVVQSGSDDAVLKSAAGIAAHPEIRVLLSNNGKSDYTKITFVSICTLGLDVGYDAGILKADKTFSLFSYLVQDNGVQFMVQCLPTDMYNSLVIPLGLDCTAGGTLVFSATTISLPDECQAILEDTSLKTFTNLRQGNYTTTITSNTLDSRRFKLHTSYYTTTYRWTGTTSNDWNTAANWSTNLVPGSAQSVLIPGSLPNYPIINSANSINNVEVAAGASLSVAAAGSLTVNGTITNNAGNSGIVILSDETGTGSLITDSSVGATFKRWITGNTWHQFSWPVVQTVASFLADPNNSVVPTNGSFRGMIDYNSSNNTWNGFKTNDDAGTATPGKGFMLRTSSNSAVTCAGLLNVGNVNVNLTKTVENGWNCIGNPYTSAIDINTLYADNGVKLDPAYRFFYVWDGSRETPQYTAHNSLIDPFDLPAGQGFFVKTNSDATPLSFTKAMQIHANAAQLKSTHDLIPEIKVFAHNNNKEVSTIVRFMRGATNGLDPAYDAGILKADPTFSLATRLVQDLGKEFTLQILPTDSFANLNIPLAIDCKAGGELLLSAKTFKLPGNCHVILEDKAGKIFTDLSVNDYLTTIEANTLASDRFVLHTSQLSSGQILPSANSPLAAFAIRNVGIKLNGWLGKETIASLYDIQGRLLLEKKLDEGSQNTLAIPAYKTGVYILKVMGQNLHKEFKIHLQE